MDVIAILAGIQDQLDIRTLQGKGPPTTDELLCEIGLRPPIDHR